MRHLLSVLHGFREKRQKHACSILQSETDLVFEVKHTVFTNLTLKQTIDKLKQQHVEQYYTDFTTNMLSTCRLSDVSEKEDCSAALDAMVKKDDG